MKKTFFILLISVVTLFSCKKDDADCPEVSTTAPAAEVTNLRTYLQTNNITATEDPRGFFYRIEVAGTGGKPSVCTDYITVNYAGTYTDGVRFDAGNNVSFRLSNLITGWQEGIPLIAKGGSMFLYLPPSLAYGANPPPPIRPNAIMIFKMDLTDIQR
ncbi:MAG: FKBP-type peptidylprolyl isomerase [Segetibacter sp.]|nr:FKBP-type peptidylprolyl isomerase [Segetibacter sp.]